MVAATKSNARSKPRLKTRPLVSAAPDDSARHAGLRYVNDTMPGIARVSRARGFGYRDADGKAVRDRATLARIASLVIPPAWTDVWICPLEDGHLQATGRDARRRKQFKYHPRWRQVRDETKYQRMVAFAQALPKLRRRVAKDLGRRGLPREKVLAAVVRLLETTLIRVGNEDYARQNRSYGLTTIHNDHARVKRGTIHFEFRGKSGVEHEIDLHDARLARIVRQCQDLPGQELFGFVDHEGKSHDIGSADVNEYLREAMGEEFTAKDFRTWAGTSLAAQALREFKDFDSQAAAKRNITRAIERVAERLGNTKTICRKCYIHPAIFEAYMEKSLVAELERRAESELRESLAELEPEEAAVLALLQERLKRQLSTPKPAPRRRRKSR